MRIDRSKMLESHLASQMQEIRRQQWLDASKEAIEEYSAFVEKHGCFGDKLRCF